MARSAACRSSSRTSEPQEAGRTPPPGDARCCATRGGSRPCRQPRWRCASARSASSRVGRTNTPELALMGTTEPEAYGPTHNPWNLGRSPGGSSGGSGAAVAAGFVPVAHANDIAGSIRIPASQCGVVGLKPSRGRVLPNRPGDAAVTMLTEGAITRTMRDTAAVLDGLSPIADARTPRRRSRPRPGPPPHRPLPRSRSPASSPTRAACRRHATRRAAGGARPSRRGGVARRAVRPRPAGWRRRAWPPRKAAVALDEWSAALGRELGEDDVEPTTWRLVSTGRALSGADVVRAQQRQEELTREHPELVGWLRPAAHPDDRGARPAARRLQAGVRARPRQRVHPRVQRDRAARAVPPPRLARRRPAPRRAARRRPWTRRRAHPRRITARSRSAVGRPPPAARLTTVCSLGPPLAGAVAVSKRVGRASFGCTRRGRGRRARTAGCGERETCALPRERAPRRHRRAARCAPRR